LSIISYEGRNNMFTHREVRYRVQVILDPAKSPVRYSVLAKFSDETKEERIASKSGTWSSEDDAVLEAKAQALMIIDEHLDRE
jgi:hypothetical protein